MKSVLATHSGESWYLNLAPQFCSLVDAELSQNFCPLKKVKGAQDLFFCQEKDPVPNTKLPQPLELSPFIRSVWGKSHLWPGALRLHDFVDRASGWAFEQVKMHQFNAVSIETSFEDKAKLKLKIKTRLEELLSGARQAQFSFEPRQGGDGLGLYILLTPEALVSCPQSYIEHGLIKALPPEIRERNLRDRKEVPEKKEKRLAESRLNLNQHFSRARKKAAEALAHASRMNWIAKPLAECHFVDLGASPGGISFTLARLCKKVTAIDRAPLATEVASLQNVEFLKGDIRQVNPAVWRFDGLFCDMNGDSRAAAESVCRFAPALNCGALVFFTLKIGRIENWKHDLAHVKRIFAEQSLKHLDTKHLYHNRNELTLFLTKT